jgi:hypothetical protein
VLSVMCTSFWCQSTLLQRAGSTASESILILPQQYGEYISLPSPSSLQHQHLSPLTNSTQLLGILVLTNGDVFSLRDWLHRHVAIFERLVIIDGTTTTSTTSRTAAANFIHSETERYSSSKTVVIIKENELHLSKVTDQTLRAPAMEALGNPVDRWIMICHADEFWTIDPRQLVQSVEKANDKNVSASAAGWVSQSEVENKKRANECYTYY